MKPVINLVVSLFLLISSNALAQTNWTFDDAHSNLQFSVTNLMVAEVEGSIQIKQATLKATKDDLSDASISILADMNTIDTDNDGRDNHLRTEEFFYVEKYPDLTFQSTSFKRIGENRYSVTGNLTFHGITKPVTLDVIGTRAVRPYDNKTIVGFKASGEINRKDFDIASTTPNAMLSDAVQVKANVIFVLE